MSSKNSPNRVDPADAGSKTPFAFYLMMGAMGLAVLYLVSLLFI